MAHLRYLPLAPRTHPPVCILLWLWFELSPTLHRRFKLLLWFSPSPPLLVIVSMPHQRGKSKHGAAWYAARGRGSRDRGRQAPQSLPQVLVRTSTMELPPDLDHASSLEHPHDRATTPDLPHLSSPYACRVEWFDRFGNSLGFAPKINPESSPIHQPPPHLPPPSAPPSPTASPSSSSSPLPSPASPSSSFDIPPPSIACSRCVGWETVKNSLDFIKRSIMDIKCAIKELHNKEDGRNRRDELLESLLRDLRQTTPDTGTLGKDTA